MFVLHIVLLLVEYTFVQKVSAWGSHLASCEGKRTNEDPVLTEIAVNGEEGRCSSDLVLWVTLAT